MFRKSIHFCVIALITIGLFSYSPPASADSREPTLLVVPTHYTIVQLAFDMAKLRRNMLIVSFSEQGVKTGQALFIWDPNTAGWTKTTFEDYSSGSLFATKPGKVIILGGEKDVPPVLANTSAWCATVKRIPTLNVMELVNSLNEDFKFSALEWRWIAKEYDLKIQDLNAERRRYGKYGKPGEKTRIPLPVSEPEKVEQPSAGPIVVPDAPAQTAPIAIPAPVEKPEEKPVVKEKKAVVPEDK
jgi:hypothetical protein